MKKAILIIPFILLIATLTVIGYSYIQKQNVENSIGNGTVLEVKENSILIQGYLISPTEEKRIVSVDFQITPDTKFKKTSLVVNVAEHSDGEPFTPEMVEGEGKLTDIRKGTVIKGVITNDKLENGESARALEIHYSMPLFQ